MSNYGFKTIKDDNSVAVNGAWPIFGFDLRRRDQLYRTFRITDLHSYLTPPNMGIDVPFVDGVNEYWGYAPQGRRTYKVLLHEYKHGLKHAPLGYTFARAKLSCARKAQVIQTDKDGSNGGNFTVDWREHPPFVNPQELYPSPAISGGTVSRENFDIAITESHTSDADGPIVPEAVPSGFFYGYGGFTNVAIKTEIDDTSVKIYLETESTEDVRRFRYEDLVDTTQRVKTWLDLAGSVYEVSVILIDKKIEDFL